MGEGGPKPEPGSVHVTIPRAQEARFVSKITITFNLISWTKPGGAASSHNELQNGAWKMKCTWQ